MFNRYEVTKVESPRGAGYSAGPLDYSGFSYGHVSVITEYDGTTNAKKDSWYFLNDGVSILKYSYPGNTLISKIPVDNTPPAQPVQDKPAPVKQPPVVVTPPPPVIDTTPVVPTPLPPPPPAAPTLTVNVIGTSPTPIYAYKSHYAFDTGQSYLSEIEWYLGTYSFAALGYALQRHSGSITTQAENGFYNFDYMLGLNNYDYVSPFVRNVTRSSNTFTIIGLTANYEVEDASTGTGWIGGIKCGVEIDTSNLIVVDADNSYAPFIFSTTYYENSNLVTEYHVEFDSSVRLPIKVWHEPMPVKKLAILIDLLVCTLHYRNAAGDLFTLQIKPFERSLGVDSRLDHFLTFSGVGRTAQKQINYDSNGAATGYTINLGNMYGTGNEDHCERDYVGNTYSSTVFINGNTNDKYTYFADYTTGFVSLHHNAVLKEEWSLIDSNTLKQYTPSNGPLATRLRNLNFNQIISTDPLLRKYNVTSPEAAYLIMGGASSLTAPIGSLAPNGVTNSLYIGLGVDLATLPTTIPEFLTFLNKPFEEDVDSPSAVNPYAFTIPYVRGVDSFVIVGFAKPTDNVVVSDYNLSNVYLSINGIRMESGFIGGSVNNQLSTGELKLYRFNLPWSIIKNASAPMVIGFEDNTGNPVSMFAIRMSSVANRVVFNSNHETMPEIPVKFKLLDNPNNIIAVVPTPDGITKQLNHVTPAVSLGATTTVEPLAPLAVDLRCLNTAVTISKISLTQKTLLTGLTPAAKTALQSDFIVSLIHNGVTILSESITLSTVTTLNLTSAITFSSSDELKLEVTFAPSLKVINVPTYVIPGTPIVPTLNVRKLKVGLLTSGGILVYPTVTFTGTVI